jgi:exodeoxyribonuclease V alpha subunit
VDELRETAEVMTVLHGLGCTPGLVRRLVAVYGRDAARIAVREPYRLAREVRGIGFLTADRIALACGMPADSPERVDAGVEHALREAEGEGHCALPSEELGRRAARLLDLDPSLVGASLVRLERARRVVREEGLVFRREMWEEEVSVARNVLRLVRTRRPLLQGAGDLLPRVLSGMGVEPTPEQVRAALLAAEGGVVVVTGNPGTGKTTTLRAVAGLLTGAGLQVAAACPTGRAAQRLAETSGLPAMTIHRLLGYTPREGFAFGEGARLPVDAVLVDEASMVDLPLMARLVEALPDGCGLVLVGDSDQLPPVGPGDVLRDLIRSGAVPCVRLGTIFRQARSSLIVANAHRVARGEFPYLPTSPGRDVLFIPAEDPEEQVGAVVRAVTEIAPSLGYAPAEVPVFCPMYRGPNGIDRLNEVLREAVNPAGPTKPELRRGGRLYRLHDRVLQVANNYRLGVMNGELGVVTGVDPEREVLEVAYPQEAVVYRREDLDEVVPAWAISVHKSQGGEYPACVVLLDVRHYVLLTRNLLYTALTRAQRLCVVVGSRKAVWLAVRNDSPQMRYTALARRLQPLGVG